MELSYAEILNVLTMIGEEGLKDAVYEGSQDFIDRDKMTPIESPAARDLVERSRAYSEDDPLYVIGIGAITNVASALLMNPTMISRIVLIWLGAHSFEWNNSHEFNMLQDVAAARIVFDSKVPLVLVPCVGVTSALTVTGPELEYWLRGKNEFCDYLVDITEKEALRYHTSAAWSRAIWDVGAVAWLVHPDFAADRIEHAPISEYDDHFAFDHNRHLIRYVSGIRRDLIFADLFAKLSQ